MRPFPQGVYYADGKVSVSLVEHLCVVSSETGRRDRRSSVLLHSPPPLRLRRYEVEARSIGAKYRYTSYASY